MNSTKMKKYVFLITFLVLSIVLVLFLVTRIAVFNNFILDENASFIGQAIGGIGTVIVGIANVIMLYLTFNNQVEINEKQAKQIEEQQNLLNQLSQKVESENKQRIKEEKYAQLLRLKNELSDIQKSWHSLVNKDLRKIYNKDILYLYGQYLDFLETIKKETDKSNKKILFSNAKLFYDQSITPTYRKIKSENIQEVDMNAMKNIHAKVEKIINTNS